MKKEKNKNGVTFFKKLCSFITHNYSNPAKIAVHVPRALMA